MESSVNNNKRQRIFDAHCHIYPAKIAAAAADSIGAFYDIPIENDGKVETLLAKGEKAGVTRYLVHSVSTTPKQVKSINEFISSQVAEHPDKFVGFGTLHQDSEDIEGDVAHLLELGLRGVKLHPDFQKCALDSEEAYNVCRAFAGKVPLLVHAGDSRYNFSNPNQLLALMEKLPDLVVIAAHFGGWSKWSDASEVLAGHPNLYVDSSSSLYSLDSKTAYELVHRFGVDRVLFGTDYPMWSIETELERFHKMGLTKEEEAKILYDNAANLLGIV